ncbi:GNAT family N-acetyltransferase [bacterium SCSIO 12741]|nr:GNAT family N-acetyltransferase [bacterium SCSIO 12741]
MKYVLNGEQTDRLDFRLVNEDDFDTWLPLFQGDAIRFLGLNPELSAEEHGRYWFNKVFHRYENDLGGMNALIERESGKLVGQCGLLVQEVQGDTLLEIGYSLLPDFRGKGYALEAAQKCKEEAFKRNYAQELISIVDINNHPSARVAQRNGMQIVRPHIIYKDCEVNIFGIGREEWLSAQKA